MTDCFLEILSHIGKTPKGIFSRLPRPPRRQFQQPRHKKIPPESRHHFLDIALGIFYLLAEIQHFKYSTYTDILWYISVINNNHWRNIECLMYQKWTH